MLRAYQLPYEQIRDDLQITPEITIAIPGYALESRPVNNLLIGTQVLTPSGAFGEAFTGNASSISLSVTVETPINERDQIGIKAVDVVHYSDFRTGSIEPFAGGQPTFNRSGIARARQIQGVIRKVANDTPRIEPDGLRLELSRENKALHSRDFTNGSWTKSGITATQDQIGVDGVASSACTLEATSSNGTVTQTVTWTSGDRCASFYLRRISGSGNIDITIDGGVTWTTVSLEDTWGRFSVTDTLSNPEIGIRITTSGDKVAADFSQVEAGLFPTSVIETTTSSVTRATEDLEFDRVPNPQALIIYSKWKDLMDGNGSGEVIWAIDDGGLSGYMSLTYVSNTDIRFTLSNGSNNDTAQITLTPEAGDILETVVILNADGSARLIGRSNDSAVVVDSFSAITGGLPSSWPTEILSLNSLETAALKGALVFQQLKIAKQGDHQSQLDGTNNGDENIMTEMSRLLLRTTGSTVNTNIT